MVEIPLFRKKQLVAYALVDDADAELVGRHEWHLNNWGYAARCASVDGKPKGVLLHRVILGLGFGDPRQADHINLNRLDCRRENLRIVPGQGANKQNIRSRKGSTSRFRGVSWDRVNQKWEARAYHGKRNFLGRFDREEDAAAACSSFRAKHMPFSEDARMVEAQ